MRTSAFSIRRATALDLDEAAALFERVANLAMPWLPRDTQNAAAFLAAAEEEIVWVAVEGGRIVGLVALFPPDAFLHSLYVAPEAQRRGIGQALLAAAAAAADRPLSLKVQERNLPARRFYARAGFTQGERGVTDGAAWLSLMRTS